jgi:predicted nucleic acid-binding protein
VKYVLDTNVVSRVLDGDERVLGPLGAVEPHDVGNIERRGRRKSDFDLVIACPAIEHRAALVTNDAALKDGTIDGLVVEDWLGGATS